MNITLNAQQRLLVIILTILTVVALALVTFTAVAHVDLIRFMEHGLGLMPRYP